jgi:hypothetical protein
MKHIFLTIISAIMMTSCATSQVSQRPIVNSTRVTENINGLKIDLVEIDEVNYTIFRAYSIDGTSVSIFVIKEETFNTKER